MPEVWGEHKCNSHDSCFYVQLCDSFVLSGFGGCFRFEGSPHLCSVALFPAGWWEIKDGWHCSLAPTALWAQVCCISLGSHTASPVLPSTPFSGHFSLRGAISIAFLLLCNANEVGCPGAANVPSYTTRTGLNIPQSFLFHFRDLITEESLNLLIVIRTCVFGSFPFLSNQLYYFCQATPSFPQLNALQGWTWDSLFQLWKMDPWISSHRCNEFCKIICSSWIVFITSRAKFSVSVQTCIPSRMG